MPDPRSSLLISALSAQFVRQGHGWITKDRETGDLAPFRPGQLADLHGPDGEWVAQALLDPGARIVARVIGRDRRSPVDDRVLADRARAALERRSRLEGASRLYRIVNADGDGLPGLTVDRYGDYLVAQLYTMAAEGLAQLVLEQLMRTGRFAGAFLKPLPRDRRQAAPGVVAESEGGEAPPRGRPARGLPARSSAAVGYWVAGEAGPSSLILEEHGMRFVLNPFEGLSTGLFLDMRDNRQLARSIAPGLEVLNAFAYTGGFSVACALAGARVDTVDLSQPALEIARQNFALNGIPEHAHRFYAQDVFPFLRGAGQRYDLVILDPPTFSTSRENVWSPGRLAEINALALSALRPGGWLMTFSNFASLKEDAFHQALHTATLEARRPIQAVSQLQAGMDFPWLPGFPESRHLKGILARVQ